VTKALLQRKIRIDGGINGVQSANKLVNVFLKPYLIDTWAEAEKQR
jgi:hypothetical protein